MKVSVTDWDVYDRNDNTQQVELTHKEAKKLVDAHIKDGWYALSDDGDGYDGNEEGDAEVNTARWDVYNEDDEEEHSNLSFNEMKEIVDKHAAKNELWYGESDDGDDYPVIGDANTEPGKLH